MGKKAAKVRELIEDIAEDAWGMAPSAQPQAEELWDCIWGCESTSVVGSTFVPLWRRQELRVAAEAAGCWWSWTSTGEPMYLPLKAAAAKFGRALDPMGATAVMSRLRAMRDASSGDDRRALEWALTRLKEGEE